MNHSPKIAETKVAPMKKILILCLVFSFVGLLSACKSGSKSFVKANFDSVKDFCPSPDKDYYADSITGYATFSAEDNIVIIPTEITKAEYDRLLTEKYTLFPTLIDTSSALFAQLEEQTQKNTDRYERMRGPFAYNENMQEVFDALGHFHYYYPETRQYETMIIAPMTNESFMMTEEGLIDSTFMQSETRTYGINGIFVGQEGHDCDFRGSLWFYKYDKQHHRMIPLCHYLDYRWSEDCGDFNLCWISEDELVVSAVSNGNNTCGWGGGYKPNNLAPHGTPVYYKLEIMIK